MASALIQSNAQSALISTLNAASSASVNPFEYTLSKRIPSHGCQWTRHSAVNPGAITAGDTLNFDLTKMGFTRSLALQVEVHHAALGAGKHLAPPRTGYLNLIERIDIESSSRRILTMSKAAILAAYSDLSYEQRMAFERGCHMHKGSKTGPHADNLASGAADAIVVTIPFLFSCFDNGNLALATGFTEPIRISIKFANSFGFVKDITTASGNGAELAASVTLSQPVLIVENRLLPNEMEDATISANYSQGPLSQLVYDYEEETEESATLQADGAAGVTISHEIKSTAVATDIYVYVEVKNGTLAMAAGGTDDDKLDVTNVPLPVDTISFRASGQTIVDDVKAEYLGLYGKRTLKDGFFGCSTAGGGYEHTAAAGQESTSDGAGNPCFVYRLQFGMDNSKQYDSSGISLRELNAPTISVTMAKCAALSNGRSFPVIAAGAACVMHTVIRKLGLQTTDSSSGRVVSTLSN
tara:strand:- start:6 stop:1412 length:1407 start_codon:yes stop_codon:yes gene_type:complete